MIYGYEQPIQLPTLDLYDKQIMAMALNAAKDMYDRNEQNLKEFYKTYGDFMSPIAADQAWWDQNMEGAARRKVNEIYARGGDPLRNRADMAELQQFVNSRPYAQAALMKESAKNAELYKQAMAKLIMEDKWNPDYENYLLGGKNLNNWSTSQNGIWDKPSPSPYNDLNTKTSHWFDKVNRNAYLYTKDGYDYFGVKPEELKSVMDSQIPDFINTPYGQYQLKLAKAQLGPNATDEEAIEQLKNNIVNSNKELTISPTREMNAIAALELKDKYAARNAERNFKYNMALQALKNAGKTSNSRNSTDTEPTGPSTLHEQIQYSVNNKVAEALGVSPNSDRRTIADNYNAVIQYYKDKVAEIEKTKGKKVQDGYEEITQDIQKPIWTTGGLPHLYGDNTNTITKRIPKYKYEYDGSKDKMYTYYKDKLKHYENLQNGGSVLTDREKTIIDNLDAYIKSGKKLTPSQYDMYKHLVQKQEKVHTDYIEDVHKALSNATKGGESFASANDKYYGMFTFTPKDKAGVETALGMFTGYSDPREFKSLPGKYAIANFGEEGMEYAPIRKANVSGPRTYKYNAIENKFSRWLKSNKIEGVMFNTTASFASIPREFSQIGESQIDVMANPSISKEDFLQFVSTLPNNIDKSDITEIARKLGLTPRNAEGTILNKDKDGYNTATYYDVPSIRTTTNHDGYAFAQMNDEYNKRKFGATKAYDNAPNSEAESLTPEELIDFNDSGYINFFE